MELDQIISISKLIAEQEFKKIKINLEELYKTEGRRGKPGKDFVFEEHQDEIFSKIENFILEIKNDFILKFTDLTEDQKKELIGKDGKDFNFEDHKNLIFNHVENFVKEIRNDLKLKFSELTKDEKKELKGVDGKDGKDGLDGVRGKDGRHGQDGKDGIDGKDGVDGLNGTNGKDGLDGKDGVDGKDGKDGLDGIKGKDGRHGQDGKDGVDGKNFVFDENKEAIDLIISKYFDLIRPVLKLNFSDLNHEEIESIRGPRGTRGRKGQNGRDGKDFVFEENKELINNEILNIVNNEKDNLRLKFSDLKEDEKEEIRGKQGKVGKRGLSAFDHWLKEGNTGTVEDFFNSLKGKDGKNGERGLRGIPGPQGFGGAKGFDGKDGKNAPKVIDIQIKKNRNNDFYFIFYFDDGSLIETNLVDLPKNGNIVHSNVSITHSFPFFNYKSYAPVYNAGEMITSVTYWKSLTQTNEFRIVKVDYSYDSGDNINTEIWSYYNDDGVTIFYTFTITYFYTGDLVTNVEIT